MFFLFSECTDNDKNCHYWGHLCYSNIYVKNNCKDTCGKCGKQKKYNFLASFAVLANLRYVKILLTNSKDHILKIVI